MKITEKEYQTVFWMETLISVIGLIGWIGGAIKGTCEGKKFAIVKGLFGSLLQISCWALTVGNAYILTDSYESKKIDDDSED